MKSLTIRINENLESQLDKIATLSGHSKSEAVREALERHLAIETFRALRKKVIPYAEAQGMLTDEDVFNEIS